jgi:hypothetical protein
LNQASLLELASRAGGRAFINTNDIRGAMHTVEDDTRVEYTLGYYPSASAHHGKFHRIAVKLRDREGVALNYRQGYVDEALPSASSHPGAGDLKNAAWSPVDASAIELKGEIAPARSSGNWKVAVRIGLADLALAEQGDLSTGRVDVLLVQKDREGGQFGTVAEARGLELKPETYRQMLQTGLSYKSVIEANPKATDVRVIVRDAGSRRIGSLTLPLR